MVKWKSCRASNPAFQVQILVGLLRIEKLNETEGQPDWRREPVGSRLSFTALRVRFPLLPLTEIYGVRGVAVSARLPVKQEVWVQLPSVTLDS